MAMDKVTVCNMALAQLGASPISAMTDEPHGPLCDLFYDGARRGVLLEDAWRCAILREKIEDDGTSVPDDRGFAYRFKLSDLTKCLQILDVTGTDGTSIRWLREGEYLYADYDTLVVRHVTDLDDEAKWHPLLVEVVSLRLAAAIAVRVKASMTAKAQLMQEYEALLLRARQINAIEVNDPNDMEEGGSEWIDSRS